MGAEPKYQKSPYWIFLTQWPSWSPEEQWVGVSRHWACLPPRAFLHQVSQSTQQECGALLATQESTAVTFTYVPVKNISGNLRTRHKNIKMNRWPPIQKECGTCRETMVKTIPKFGCGPWVWLRCLAWEAWGCFYFCHGLRLEEALHAVLTASFIFTSPQTRSQQSSVVLIPLPTQWFWEKRGQVSNDYLKLSLEATKNKINIPAFLSLSRCRFCPMLSQKHKSRKGFLGPATLSHWVLPLAQCGGGLRGLGCSIGLARAGPDPLPVPASVRSSFNHVDMQKRPLAVPLFPLHFIMCPFKYEIKH